jgi:F420H(2)-dependent biliverdin reductase
MALDLHKLQKAVPRLEHEANIWLATVRPDRRPHLVPIWFVWNDNKVWICTPESSQKMRNLRANPSAMAALEGGDSPVILEGTAVSRPVAACPDAVALAFQQKYDWNIRTDDDEDYILIEFTPTRLIAW